MEIKGTQFIPEQDQASSAATVSAASKTPKVSTSAWKEKLKTRLGVTGKIMKVGDLILVILAAAVAVTAYSIAISILPEEMKYWVRHLVGLILGLAVLIGVKSVQKTPSVIGTSVAIFMFVLFSYNIAIHYFVPKTGDYVSGQDIPSNEFAVNPRDSISGLSPDSVSILSFGAHQFVLKDSASTKWLATPKNSYCHYTISSPTYNYKIIFSDGAEYKGNAKTEILWREKPVFKIQALGKDSVAVTITRG